VCVNSGSQAHSERLVAAGRVWWWAQNWAQSPRDHRERQVPGALPGAPSPVRTYCELPSTSLPPAAALAQQQPQQLPPVARVRGTLALLSLGATLAPALALIPPSLCAASRLRHTCRLCAGSSHHASHAAPASGAPVWKRRAQRDAVCDPPESTLRHALDAELSGMRRCSGFDAFHAASSAAGFLIDCSNDRNLTRPSVD